MSTIKKVSLEDSHSVKMVVEDVYLGHANPAINGAKKKIVLNDGAFAHEDLINCFRDLGIHLAAICEQGEFTQLEEDEDLLGKFFVTAIEVDGEGEGRGVILTGYRKLKKEKTLHLQTPFTKLIQDQSDYAYAASLEEKVEQLLAEASEYMLGKHAPSRQLDLFNEEEEHVEEEEEEKPKRSRRKTSELRVAS